MDAAGLGHSFDHQSLLASSGIFLHLVAYIQRPGEIIVPC